MLLIGFVTKYCSAKQSCLVFHPGTGYRFDVTSQFIVHFQRILKFLKASGKRWFFFVLICFFKAVHAKVLTRWSPVWCICWHISLPFWKSVLIFVSFLLCTFKQQFNFNNVCEKLCKELLLFDDWLKQLFSVTYIPTSSCQLRHTVPAPLDSGYTNCTCVGSTCRVLNLSTQLGVLKTLFPWFVFIPPLSSVSS